MDKPLHVQVAEALCWQRCYLKAEYGAFELYKSDDWRGFPPGRSVVTSGSPLVEIPHYDSDWSATGPLIERLRPLGFQLLARDQPSVATGKRCCAYIMGTAEGWGETELQAVCSLILQLHKAGKLP